MTRINISVQNLKRECQRLTAGGLSTSITLAKERRARLFSAPYLTADCLTLKDLANMIEEDTSLDAPQCHEIPSM